MTQLEFRTRVLQEAVRAKGETTYNAADTTKITSLINQQLDHLASAHRLIQVSAAPLTLVVETPTYDIRASGLSRRMSVVNDVTIDGNVLQNYDWKNGPCSPQDVYRFERNVATAGTGRPAKWWREGSNRIQLFKAPDAVYSCTMLGYGLPVAPANDAAEMDWPEEILEAAILWCAFVVCGRGRGYSAPEVLELAELSKGPIRAFESKIVGSATSLRTREVDPRMYGRMR